jgi:hypothetical protein
MEKFRSGIRDGKIRIWDQHPGSATLKKDSKSDKDNNDIKILSFIKI